MFFSGFGMIDYPREIPSRMTSVSYRTSHFTISISTTKSVPPALAGVAADPRETGGDPSATQVAADPRVVVAQGVRAA
jgi:hypothetical protein